MRKITITIFITLILFNTILATITFGQNMNPFFDNYKNQFENDSANVMLTGYWNPTGQMIAQFSTDPYLNPDGWKGENWENRGYNIYSFFPTPDTYNGTFEVDYQDTWDDFWNITSQLKPIAIISFGAGDGPWEIEYNARNLDRWYNDNKPPYQPTPCPPDDTVPAGFVRHSTLPVQEIKDAVNKQTSVQAWIDWDGNPGAYLCEYMAYLGMWYKSINENDTTYPCKAAGFIHVKNSISLDDAKDATNVTIRETIKYLNCVKNPPATPNIKGTTIGKPGEEYTYFLNTTDENNDDIFYYIDWGDGNFEEWIGPYESGKNVSVSHLWNSIGKYEIKVAAKDTCGSISDWGYLNVKIPRNKVNYDLLSFCLTNQFQKIFSMFKYFLN